MIMRSWDDFKKNFPWKSMTIGFLVPKGMLFAGISLNMLFAGALSATLWCGMVLLYGAMHEKKMNIFAVVAFMMIFMRVAVVLSSKSPELYMIAQAVDSSLYAFAFLVSLLFPRSIIQIFAEEAGVALPESIRTSGFYKRAWDIVSAVWGAVFAVVAVALVAARFIDMKAAVMVDMVSSWPPMVFLIAFTVIFPRWYWTKTIGEAHVKEIVS